jgi:ribosomal biogenesis protein LAS1
VFFDIYVNLFLGRNPQTSSDHRQEICQIEHLSFLFAWLVVSLKELKPRRHKDSAAEIKVSPTETFVSKTFLLDLLRKSLLVSTPGNKQILDSALHLTQLIGSSLLMEKLKKLPMLGSSNSEEEIEIPSTTNLLVQHEESIRQAATKLELVKLHRSKSKVVETRAGDAENSNRWVRSRSWNPCPIGMLPHTLGSSGRLPVLDCHDNNHGKMPESSERKEKRELNRCSGKREASCDIQLIDNTGVKKRRETMEGRDSDPVDALPLEVVKGHLMIGGIWKGIGEDELLALESDVRVLV